MQQSVHRFITYIINYIQKKIIWEIFTDYSSMRLIKKAEFY